MAQLKLPKNFATVAASMKKHCWSDEQEEIFEWFESGSGNLVVRARAGTGKTSTLLEGINWAPEQRILLAAFNKSIADEMKSRVINPAVRVQTLHSLGLSICRRHVDKLEVDAHGERARALSKAACVAVLKRHEKPVKKFDFDVIAAVTNLHTKIREILVDPVGDFELEQQRLATDKERAASFNRFHNDMQRFANRFDIGVESDDFWDLNTLIEAALEAVKLAKVPAQKIDFADMIFLPLVNGWATSVPCDLLVIDESQDMSEAQLNLALSAVSPTGRICLVGDERQAIYGFRGADIDSLDRLKEALGAQELGLTTTYRCAKTIVDVARNFASDFQAAPTAVAGEVIELVEVGEIFRLAEPGDFILSRTNAALVVVCTGLRDAGKRVIIKGSDIGARLGRLLDRLEREYSYTVTDVHRAMEAWYKVEKTKLSKLEKAAADEKRADLDDLYQMLGSFTQLGGGLMVVRTAIAATFSEDASDKMIVCSTVHKAKGLEANRVFLLAYTFRRNAREEENICYVAATRAKTTLFLVGRTRREFLQGGTLIENAAADTW